MFKRILMAVDLTHTELSDRAIEVATRMTRDSGGPLHVMAVAPDFGMTIVGGFFDQSFLEKTLGHAKQELNAYAAKMFPSDLPVETHLGHGDVTEQVLSAAGKIDADLIILSSRQPNMMHGLLVGSHASRLADKSPVSVLIVREDEEKAG